MIPSYWRVPQNAGRGATLITSNLPFDEWTETLGTARLTGARLDRLTHHVNILEMNGESYVSGRWVSDSTPRERQELDPGSCCPDCGGDLRLVGEDASEMLDMIAAQLKVVQIVRLLIFTQN